MKKFMMFISILLLGYMITGRIAAADVPVADTGVVSNDPPIMKLDDKYYTFSDMTGIKQSNYLAQVKAEAISLSDAQLIQYIGQFWNASPSFGTPRDLSKKTPRSDLEDDYCNLAYLTAIDQASFNFVPAAVVDHILKDHKISLSDYYDLNVLDQGALQEDEYIKFVYDHRNDLAGHKDDLYQEAIKRFNIKPNLDGWNFAIQTYPQTPPFTDLLNAAEIQNANLRATLVKSSLLYELVKDACDHGIYHDMGRDYYLFQGSSFYVIDVDGYQGKPEILQHYFSHLVDDQGIISLGGISLLTEWLKKYARTVSVTVEEKPGSLLASQFRIPVIGSLMAMGPDHFRFITYNQRATEPSDIKSKQMYENLYKHFANVLVSQEYMPTITSLTPRWHPNIAILGIIEMPAAIDCCGDINLPNFTKKPYSSDIFADFENNRSSLQDAAVSAADVTTHTNPSSIQMLIQKLDTLQANAKTEPVKNVYTQISKDISLRANKVLSK